MKTPLWFPQSFFARTLWLVLIVVLFSKALTLVYLLMNEDVIVDRQYLSLIHIFEGRRGAEQVHQQPAVAAEIANQGDVGGGLVVAFRQLAAFGLAQQRPEPLRQGEVVVDAGDALHGLAVTQRQALAAVSYTHLDVYKRQT